MTAAIQVSSQILNILLRYIDEEGIANADFRSRIEAAKSVDRISIEHWWGFVNGVLGILPPYIAKPSEAPVCRGL